MKILFIGPTHQSDGWGIAAREYVHALLKTGYDIASRPIYMSNHIEKNVDIEIIRTEMVHHDSYDVVIQNVLPNLMFNDKRCGKNIALIHTESSFKYTTWPLYLNMMDEIWVPSNADDVNCNISGVTRPIKIVGIPTDLNKYLSSYEEPNFIKEDEFYFYFIGEYIQRKNVLNLVRAFHATFHPSENVNLILKINKSGLNPVQLGQVISEDLTRVKTNLRIFNSIEKYRKEIVITDKISQQHLFGLHQACNCFVMPSCGESWSIPTFDAFGFGKDVIITEKIGPCDYARQYGWEIDSSREFCNVSDAPLPDLYTGKDTWRQPSMLSLSHQMRQAYENREEQNNTYIENYSREKVGLKLKEILSV